MPQYNVSSPQMGSMMGMVDMNADEMSSKLDDMMATIRQVNDQFKNPVRPYSLRCWLFMPRLKMVTGIKSCSCRLFDVCPSILNSCNCNSVLGLMPCCAWRWEFTVTCSVLTFGPCVQAPGGGICHILWQALVSFYMFKCNLFYLITWLTCSLNVVMGIIQQVSTFGNISWWSKCLLCIETVNNYLRKKGSSSDPAQTLSIVTSNNIINYRPYCFPSD